MSALSPVAEIKLDLTGKPVDDLSPVYEILSNGDAELVRVLCIDISKWIDKTDTEVFKKLLKDLQKASDKFIFAFRVPFVDKDVLGRVATSLNDLMSVRVLSIPPFDNVQTKEIARRDLQNYGLEMSVAAWQCFFERIAEEKRDGKFYGLNTIKKVVKELVYKKQVALSNGAKDATLIGVKDARKICSYKDDKGEGMAQLDKLVGCEQIKRQIEEILAQIELAKTQNGLEKPCLHMRFVGSPGTGKTTVARILGKILKEKEVLRIGNLYEYKGRDFADNISVKPLPKRPECAATHTARCCLSTRRIRFTEATTTVGITASRQSTRSYPRWKITKTILSSSWRDIPTIWKTYGRQQRFEKQNAVHHRVSEFHARATFRDIQVYGGGQI